ncbi:MAG: PD40 domain-containing protein [Gemmatimonadetes bacterium]|nr:PD40 domain-containing protein [Gemmatimonadota bacterium]
MDQLENDPYIFPYRYGQALLAFIGQRWGDEAIGAIMQGTLAGGGGLRGAMRRVLGVDYPQLSAMWRQHIQETYLPEVATRTRARDIAREVLSQDRSEGTLHLAPALSPDGKQVVYFSEKDFYFIDLYLADAETGKVERRLSKSSYSSNYETFRFINSQANWSPDGKYLAFAAKRGPRDDIIILDVKRNREVRRIEVEMNGVTTPSWSPDGKSLVFTGYVGGLSDLFIVGADGKGLRRLTGDRYADLHPVWSPDGKTIAFASDRGPDTDFERLEIGNMRICTLDLATGRVSVLPGMDVGKNVSPQWGPDGRDIAFVSDRDGVSNIFLYSLNDTRIYQITDLFTGAQGITPLSPVLSWAQGADRLAFVYYTRDMFDVYAIDHPGSLKAKAWEPKAQPSRRDVATLGPRLRPQAGAGDSVRAPGDTTTARDTAAARTPLESSGSLYISPNGIRSADSAPVVTDSLLRPVTITALLDSTNVPLPDTAEFVVKDYKVQFRPDFVSRPTIGYTRDNFGRGFYGGSAIQLSDMLGNHNLIFAAFINGRITEAMVNATYVNLERRVNWAVSVGQEPYYFLEPSYIVADSPQVGDRVFVTNLRRIVLRSVQAQALYPVSRFARFEAGMTAATISDRLQSIYEPYDPGSGLPTDNPTSRERGLPGASYVEPELAYVFDNSLPGYVGPFYGRRYRLSVSQTIGGWRFFQGLADYRRYDKIVGPLVFATRGLYFGRIGRDAERFRIFLGNPDLLRGNTSGSYYNHECTTQDPNTTTGCVELDRLVGTQIAVGSAEIRFPILTPQFKFVPAGFPPIEGALFYDVGLAWNEGNTLKWKREAGRRPGERAHPTAGVRRLGADEPLRVRGASARLFDPAGAAGHQGVLDAEPGAGLLARGARAFRGVSGASRQAGRPGSFSGGGNAFPVPDPGLFSPRADPSPAGAAGRAPPRGVRLRNPALRPRPVRRHHDAPVERAAPAGGRGPGLAVPPAEARCLGLDHRCHPPAAQAGDRRGPGPGPGVRAGQQGQRCGGAGPALAPAPPGPRQQCARGHHGAGQRGLHGGRQPAGAAVRAAESGPVSGQAPGAPQGPLRGPGTGPARGHVWHHGQPDPPDHRRRAELGPGPHGRCGRHLLGRPRGHRGRQRGADPGPRGCGEGRHHPGVRPRARGGVLALWPPLLRGPA